MLQKSVASTPEETSLQVTAENWQGGVDMTLCYRADTFSGDQKSSIITADNLTAVYGHAWNMSYVEFYVMVDYHSKVIVTTYETPKNLSDL